MGEEKGGYREKKIGAKKSSRDSTSFLCHDFAVMLYTTFSYLNAHGRNVLFPWELSPDTILMVCGVSHGGATPPGAILAVSCPGRFAMSPCNDQQGRHRHHRPFCFDTTISNTTYSTSFQANQAKHIHSPYLSGTTPPDLMMGARVVSVVSASSITSSGSLT